MSSLRQIDGSSAGPAALGILAPPGRRTILILRPRALDWDLVLVSTPTGTTFRELTRAEAAAGTRALLRALEAWIAGGPGGIEPVRLPGGGYHLRASVADFPLLVCPRRPGQPYQPLVCLDLEEVGRAAGALHDALRPAPGVAREVYVNDAHFSR